MANILPDLNVHVLGGFSITYGETPVSFGRNSVTRAMKLLQILIYRGEKGISRELLLEELYGREELTDVANNLRVTVHRLKKVLEEAGLPKHNYITTEKGIYRWNAPMNTVVDARVFSRLIGKADTTDNKTEKTALLKEACLMYCGDFLPGLSGEEWVLIEGVLYKEMYTEALKQLCKMLMENGEYEEVLKLCAPACEMYPFDEWQAVRIDCYMAMNRYKEAMMEYEETARLFFEELGITPSGKMMDQFKTMSSQMDHKPQALHEIKDGLQEENEKEEDGAYFCNLPSFRDSYRLVSRIIERSGQSVFLMLCSITNGKGKPIENEERLKVMSEQLFEAVKSSLRRGDSFTKYSPSQFLILLVGTNKENCDMIYKRIKKGFSQDHKSWEQYIDYIVTSIADVEQEISSIKFDGNDLTW